MGPTAVLIEDLDAAPATVGESVRELGLAGVIEIVPAAETLLITVDGTERLDDVIGALGGLRRSRDHEVGGRVVRIPVRYDGDDLSDVAARAGLRVDELIERHASATYQVAFCGFAPGFAYLDGLPSELHLARRATPRTRVPAGSVAIAAGFSAVYPTASPGGWHLLGRTDMILFDVHEDPPAHLTPGTTVRFEPR